MSHTIAVQTASKKRRKAPLIAAGVAAAVALGGAGTFALWSDSLPFAGGTITAGDLDLASGADTAWYDISSDRTDVTEIAALGVDGHAITSLDDWRIVPGDEVAGVFSATVTLEGDNMVAKLSTASSASALANTGMTYEYAILDSAGNEVVARTALPSSGLDGATLAYLSAPMTGQDAGATDANATVVEMTSTTATYTVVIYGEFDATAQDNVRAVDTIGAITLDLTQVRDTGDSF